MRWYQAPAQVTGRLKQAIERVDARSVLSLCSDEEIKELNLHASRASNLLQYATMQNTSVQLQKKGDVAYNETQSRYSFAVEFYVLKSGGQHLVNRQGIPVTMYLTVFRNKSGWHCSFTQLLISLCSRFQYPGGYREFCRRNNLPAKYLEPADGKWKMF